MMPLRRTPACRPIDRRGAAIERHAASFALAVVVGLSSSLAQAQVLDRGPYLHQVTPTSIVIAWRTDLDTDAIVRWGVEVLSEELTDPTLSRHHEVRLTGLLPSTRYRYAIAYSTAGGRQQLAGMDPSVTFSTAPPVGSSTSFRAWIVGDSGNGSSAQRLVRNAAYGGSVNHRADLFLHVGDMAYGDGTDSEFTGYFFGVYADLLRQTPIWPAMGNHEGHSADSGTETGPYYEAYALPRQGEAGGVPSGTEAYYSFDYGQAHFIVLDSHDSPREVGGTMLNWLEADLAAADARWLITLWHHPPYSKGSHDSDTEGQLIEMRQNVLPILEAAGVDLVLTGHSHIYERSFLIQGAYDTPTTAPGHIVDSGDGNPASSGPYRRNPSTPGSIHVVAGHGGASLDQIGTHPLMAVTQVAFGSCFLDVTNDALRLYNLRADGVVTDEVVLLAEAGSTWQSEEPLAPELTEVVAIDFGGTWRYWDSPSAPASDWQLGTDGGFVEGVGQLGYGDDDETTVLANTDPNTPSAYFVTTFPLTVIPTRAEVRLIADDGAAVWLNGALVHARYMENGFEHDAWASETSADNEESRVVLGASAAWRTDGANVIAVQVKQDGPTSSDLSFDLELRVFGRPAPPDEPPPTDVAPQPDAGCDCANSGSGGAAWLIALLALAVRSWRRPLQLCSRRHRRS